MNVTLLVFLILLGFSVVAWILHAFYRRRPKHAIGYCIICGHWDKL